MKIKNLGSVWYLDAPICSNFIILQVYNKSKILSLMANLVKKRNLKITQIMEMEILFLLNFLPHPLYI